MDELVTAPSAVELVRAMFTLPKGSGRTAFAVRDVVVSFDIDGTLEVGDPPGPIGLHHVVQTASRGFLVGSASDRTLRAQCDLWQRIDVVPAFICHKHRLIDVTNRFSNQRRLHVGDTTMDAHYAAEASFEFCQPDEYVASINAFAASA